MASPRRARSLFLSPDKAELLAAKEINSLVHHIEVVPRKPVPRQGRRPDKVVEASFSDENRSSTTSTIRTVDAFCKEYRPPPVELHRLSDLDKELPPTPPSQTPTQPPSQDKLVSRIYSQKNAATQTNISVQSRYSTRIKPYTPSRLSTVSTQQRDPKDRISIRSQYSTQDFPIDQAFPRSERRSSVATDRRRPSVVRDVSKEEVRRRKSGSISPGTVPHQESSSAAATREIQAPRRQEAEIVPWASQQIQRPLTSTNSKDMVLTRQSTRKISMGWTFSDGLVLRAENRLNSTKGKFPVSENLALQPTSKRMKPIRWTFHDGIIYKVIEMPKSNDGMSVATSKRMLPIGWSFYEGLTIRPDGSVKAVSKATPRSEEILQGSKTKRMIPIGWTFHEGLIFATQEPVKDTLNSPDNSNGRQIVASSKRLPVAWSFHDGLTFATNGSVKAVPPNSPNENNDRDVEASSKRRPITWTFHEGITFATQEPLKGPLDSTEERQALKPEASSKRIPIAWNFHDGITFATHEPIKGALNSPDERIALETEASSKGLPIGWTFHDGLTLKTDAIQSRPTAVA